MVGLGRKEKVKEGKSRGILLVGFMLLSFSVFSLTNKEKNTITSIENTIQSGRLKQAEGLLKRCIKSKSGSLNARYAYQKLLSKVFLHQQLFDKYLKSCDQALKVARRLDPIYVSEVYANKAYYWHYMMWSDSALVYSDKAMRLFRKHQASKEKIDVPFLYEIYAITYLYREVKQPPKAYLDVPIPEFKRIQFQWFDSALYYQKEFPFKFSSDLAMLYRSYANRWLDIVSGERKNPNSALQKLAFTKANDLYDKGLACLKPWHRNDRLVLAGLKGAIHTYTRKYAEADEIFNQVLQRFSQKELLDRSKVAYQPLIVFQTFRVRNSLFLPYNKKKIDDLISQMSLLRGDFWRSFDAQNDNPYDPYRTSPYSNLFNLLAKKAMNEQNGEKYFSAAVSHFLTLKSYFHYLRNWKDRSFNSVPYCDLKRIQKGLKKDECYLLMIDSDLMDGKKIMITRSAAKFVNSSIQGLLNERRYDTLSFRSFQQKSFTDYQNNFESVFREMPWVKKVFVNYDDKNAYEVMVKDTLGTSFADAHYLGTSINFVRIYDAVAYFSAEKSIEMSQMDVRFLKQRGQSTLNFMNDFFKNFNPVSKYSNKAYRGNIKHLLNRPGILHIYGHGELTMDEVARTYNFQMQYLLSNATQSERRLTGDFKVKRDLVVLNNCFSGYPMFNVNEFNKTIPLRIMSNGASSVLVSPSKADDYFSSEFFRVFYQKISAGVLFEDAVFQARNAFFKANPSLRHPKYWDAFQLVVSRKISYAPNESEKLPLQWWIILLLVDFSATLLGAWWCRNGSVRHLTGPTS
jgi:hypothetical protein